MKLIKLLAASITEALSMIAGLLLFIIAAVTIITLLLGLAVVNEGKSRLHSG